MTGAAIRAGILLVVLCFLVLAEWTIRNAARNDAFDASVRIAEAAGRIRRAIDKNRFFTSLSQMPGHRGGEDFFFSSLDAALGHHWNPDGPDPQEQVRVWRFGADGRLMDVQGSASETADIEVIWNAAVLKACQAEFKPISPDAGTTMKKGLKAAQRIFSPFMDLDGIWHASTFMLSARNAAQQEFRLAVVRNDSESSRDRSGWLGFLREDAIDPLFVERRIASALPFADVDYCAIQHRRRLLIPKTHCLTSTTWRSLGLVPDDNRTLTNRFGMFAAFRLPEGHILALGCRPGRAGSIPGWARLAAGCLCLLFAMTGGRGLAHIFTARQSSGLGLQAKIFAMFFLASLVPLGAFLLIGLSEAADSKDAARRFWSSRLLLNVDAANRRFKNHLESMQIDMSELARELEGQLAAGNQAGVRHILEEKTQGNFGICFTADGQALRKLSKRYYSSEFEKGVRTLGELLFMRIIETARGEPESPTRRERSIRLDASDILGDGHPMMQIIQAPGRIMRGNLFRREVITFWDLLQDARGRSIGALFVNLMIDDVANRVGKLLPGFDETNGVWTRLMIDSMLCPDNIGNSPDLVRMSLNVLGTGGDGEGVADVDGHRKLVAIRPSSFNSNAAFLSMMPYETVMTTFRRSSGAIFGGLILSLLPVVAIAFFLNRRIAGPIAALTKAGRRVAAGDDTVFLPVEGPTEISSLAASFNGMVEGLRQRERMRRYLSAAAWETSSGGATAEHVEVAVLSSDIRGFTTLSERHSAGEIVSLLNDYFTGMERVIRRHGGDVDRFIGDAITAVFCRRPGEGESEFCMRAVQAGIGMRSALDGFNAARNAAGTFTVENGIGIDVGVAVRGLVGAVEGRRDLSIVGNVVAGAAECEAASRFGTRTKVIVSSRVTGGLRTGFTWNRLQAPGLRADMFELERAS